jgi:hypothetical protein
MEEGCGECVEMNRQMALDSKMGPPGVTSRGSLPFGFICRHRRVMGVVETEINRATHQVSSNWGGFCRSAVQALTLVKM